MAVKEEAMKPYDASFAVGSHVRIAERARLQRFLEEWKYHNRLEPEQLEFGGKMAKIAKVGFYHGGEPLYTLEGVPGIWHEECLESPG